MFICYKLRTINKFNTILNKQLCKLIFPLEIIEYSIKMFVFLDLTYYNII